VVGRLSIATSQAGWQVIPLAPNGEHGAPLVATLADGRLAFGLAPQAATIYYLLEAAP
jgi:hypothetical protein